MWGLVESGSITKLINKPKGMVIGDTRHSRKIFELWSKSELEAIGIYEVEFDNTNKKDEQWYANTNQSFAFAGGKITASYGTATAKPHADTTWTQADSDNGDLPSDKSVGDIKSRGLKYNLIQTIKQQAAGILRDTDWYIVRKADAGTAVPSSITTHRAAVRTKAAAQETQITNASDTPALETLYTYVNTADEGDPEVIERPLGQLPTLES
jgi:hypothetical protein